MKTAKEVRAQLCRDSECVYDAGCGCLDAIGAALAEHQAEIERLRSALRPFAAMASRFDASWPDDAEIVCQTRRIGPIVIFTLSAGDFRAADEQNGDK